MKTVSVALTGLTPIMLDAFRGQEELPPEQKLYYAPDKKTLILPASNIMGFLTSKSSHSCLRVFTSNKDWKTRGPEVVGNVYIDPVNIPFLNDDEPIVFEKFNEKVYVDEVEQEFDPLAVCKFNYLPETTYPPADMKYYEALVDEQLLKIDVGALGDTA